MIECSFWAHIAALRLNFIGPSEGRNGMKTMHSEFCVVDKEIVVVKYIL